MTSNWLHELTNGRTETKSDFKESKVIRAIKWYEDVESHDQWYSE